MNAKNPLRIFSYVGHDLKDPSGRIAIALLGALGLFLMLGVYL